VGRRETRASQARWLRSYCQIYCQKRGGEGISGDNEFLVFSNLLISICVSVGSNPGRSSFHRFLDRVNVGIRCAVEPRGVHAQHDLDAVSVLLRDP
jgi:hypothetical protein